MLHGRTVLPNSTEFGRTPESVAHACFVYTSCACVCVHWSFVSSLLSCELKFQFFSAQKCLELGDEIKKTNPSKFRHIKELLKPYRKSIRKLRDPAVDIHEKRKVLQKPDVGEGLLESVESVVTPLLKKKRK